MLSLSVLWLAACVSAAKFSASSFAGSTTTDVWPPPGATQDTGVFQSNVGPPGATPTGAEPQAIATAPAAVLNTDYFPLLNPGSKDHKNANIPRLWGNLAPWFSIPSHVKSASPQVPAGCELNQVHLLHRHGARYPTGGAPPSAFAAKLNQAVANGTGFTATGELTFLNTWTYKLGAEVLTPFGREQMFNLGVGFRTKYGSLLDGFSALPVFRTTSEDRMLKSALNFGAGFFGIPEYITAYDQYITVETAGINNTLSPYDTCINSNLPVGNFGSVQALKWQEVYLAPALKRFQKEVTGLNLTIPDVFAMQNLCAYETVALGFSTFCDLFTEDEWNGFEYSLDVSFWYSNSFGNPTSAAMGVGWVQELVSRLTQTPIQINNSTTNGTIDDNKETFPLNQPIYVDATHDTIISAIIVALNFTSFAAAGPLPVNKIQSHQSFITNQVSPFGANLVGQVLSCPASKTPTHIRFILNDAVVPLTGVKNCKSDKNGLCELDTFVSAMRERIGEINFAFDCLANYTIPNPANITDGRPPASIRPGGK